MPADIESSSVNSSNPLLQGLAPVRNRISVLNEKTKQLYFRVLLGQYRCPRCEDYDLSMTGQGQCGCPCGHSFDPTIEFQRSGCCQAALVRKTYHYACSKCGRSVASRFLFDERVFDAGYFKEMMQASRVRERKRKEELRMLLADYRSESLTFADEPCLDAVPGLVEALDSFIGRESGKPGHLSYEAKKGFEMDDYRAHILSSLGWGSRLFSSIGGLAEDCRADRIYRFVTLVFMQHEREVEIHQLEDDLLVERI